jgi:hypothetical protein
MNTGREVEFMISDSPMVNNAFETPVVLIIFNRPEHTKKVLEKIRDVRPKKLYVISDGPRTGKALDPELVLACRRLINEIDWGCEVVRDFAEHNLGCRERVVTGLSNVFKQEDRAIILEDDCLPSKSFFYFTQSLLDRYADDPRVGSIGGTLPTGISHPGPESYFFSKYPQIWGWGTWSRVWTNYDASIADWPTMRTTNFLDGKLHSKKAAANWRWNFDSVYKSQIDTWDYQFIFSMWRHNLLTVIPSSNLISNIGFGPDATHTFDTSSKFSNIACNDIRFPLVHPEFVSTTSVDEVMDKLLFQTSRFEAKIGTMFGKSPKWVRATLLTVRKLARELLALK